MLTISAASTVYLRAVVDVWDETGTRVDPTGDTVAVGYSATAAAPASFTTAAWVTDTSGSPTVYRARVLYTAGDLTAGTYTMWVKITDNPEVPIIPAGIFRVV